MNDRLRERLGRLDPARADRSVDPSSSRPAPDLLERVMSTPVLDPARPAARSGSRSWLPLGLAGAAAAVAVVGVGAAVLPADPVSPADEGGGTSALTVTPSDPLTSICAPFDAALLEGFPIAFAGTATAVADGTATLEVDRWYRGGDASTVTLAGPDSAALTGFDVQVGEEYLITAEDGAVTNCGYSGPATPELEAAYAQAFGG